MHTQVPQLTSPVSDDYLFIETINKVCVTPDGEFIVSAGYERHIKIWRKENCYGKGAKVPHGEFKNVHYCTSTFCDCVI